MTPEEIAWLSGLFEGEGTVSLINDKRDKADPRLSISIEMTDEDVIVRAQAIAGVGRVYGPRQRKGNRKPLWKWYVYVPKEAYELLEAMWPWLGSRRRARIQEATRYLRKVEA